MLNTLLVDRSSSGGAEAELCNYQLGKLLVCVRAEGGARAPRAPPGWLHHCFLLPEILLGLKFHVYHSVDYNILLMI